MKTTRSRHGIHLPSPFADLTALERSLMEGVEHLSDRLDKAEAALALATKTMMEGEATRDRMMRQFLGITPLDDGGYLATPKLAIGDGKKSDGIMGDTLDNVRGPGGDRDWGG